jgi:salicylate hydroxylase
MTGSRTVIIAGAGIGGLTAALALAARGYQVRIFEKADRLEEVGAGLQLSPNASRILVGLGLRDRLTELASRPDGVSLMTARSGGEVIRMPLTDAVAPDAPYWLLHRADLQAALLAQVNDHPAIELRLGHPLTDFDVRADGVSIIGDARPPAMALIGADGAWSAVREKLFPDIRPRFSGLMAWRGTVATALLPAALAPNRVQLWMGPSAHLVAYPMSAGRQINLVAIVPGDALAPGWSAPGDARELTHHFAAAGWPAPARGLIDAVDNWRRWPLYTMPDGGAWGRGPVALLGDAAHAMLPFAAQGAGMAIEDAAVLAQCLADPVNAVARYSALRRPRVTRVQQTARQSGQIYHLRGPMALARDSVMRLLGAQRLQLRQQWIYDWTA